MSRGNVAKVDIIIHSYLQQVLNAEGVRASMIVKAEGEASSKLMAAQAEKQSLEMIASALEGTGIMATEYMVAQQYLNILCNLMAKQAADSKVVLLPSKTIGDIQSIVAANCQSVQQFVC